MLPSLWIRNVKLALIFLFVSPLLTGCWDRLEIEERAVVLAIAVDEAKPSEAKEEKIVTHLAGKVPQSQKRMIRLTAQIAIPGRIPLGPAMGGGSGGEKPVWVSNVVGHTLDDAIDNLQQQLAGQLFFGHLRVIVVNEEVAKTGLQNLNDALRRNPEVRRAAWMIISKGKASDILTMEPELERVPALYLMQMLDGAVKQGKLPNTFLGVYWSALSSKGQEGYIPYIEMEEDNTILISGLAYFKGDKMVGTTTPLEIGNYMAMKAINPGGYSAMTQVPGKPGAVLFLSRSRTSKMNVDIKNGLPSVSIKVHIEGEVQEKSNNQFQVEKPDIIAKIEEQVGKNAEEAFLKLIKRTQKQESDIFGIGEYVRGQHSAYWNKHIRTKEKWQKMYKDIPVEMDVSISIRRVGMEAK